ncbi:MAG: acyl-CoA dehydrogenase family protein [Desulfarculaceae bacterium]|nr:acyl-CoA dehydrogenase family protein [Desulfarculaceae bacterium]
MLFLTQEQHELRQRVEALVREKIAPIAREIEGTHAFPQKAYEAFAQEKLFALAMPREYGGAEGDATSLALMVETIAAQSPSAALMVFVTNAVLRTIAITGTREQKKRLFAELKSGDKALGFCLTEPDYGSDAASLQTKAEPTEGGYLVSGSKTYITIGPHGRYYLVFARTGPGPRAAGISALLVDRNAEGVVFAPPEKKMGLHGSITSQMFLDKVFVPENMRLWPEGEGWRVLADVSNPMRVWGAASLALGTAQGVLNDCLNFAVERRLLSEQAIAFTLAEMEMQIEACRSLNYRVCRLVDDHRSSARQVESMVSMAKCFAADTGMKVADMASTVLGTEMAKADNASAQLFRAAKGIQIFDGSNQIQRLIVARNLAAKVRDK